FCDTTILTEPIQLRHDSRQSFGGSFMIALSGIAIQSKIYESSASLVYRGTSTLETSFELLTGHLRFPATDILELVHCHIAQPPVRPHKLNGVIPLPVSDLILKLMAKNAAD
ncbi:MAG TPA: hypothetical protein V6C65_13065, partial [Allocoleopsis sp.]